MCVSGLTIMWSGRARGLIPGQTRLFASHLASNGHARMLVEISRGITVLVPIWRRQSSNLVSFALGCGWCIALPSCCADRPAPPAPHKAPGLDWDEDEDDAQLENESAVSKKLTETAQRGVQPQRHLCAQCAAGVRISVRPLCGGGRAEGSEWVKAHRVLSARWDHDVR